MKTTVGSFCPEKIIFITSVLCGKGIFRGKPLHILLKTKWSLRITLGHITNCVNFTKALDPYPYCWFLIVMVITMTPSLALIRNIGFWHIKYVQGISLRIRHGWLWNPQYLVCLIILLHPSHLLKWSLRKSSHI